MVFYCPRKLHSRNNASVLYYRKQHIADPSDKLDFSQPNVKAESVSRFLALVFKKRDICFQARAKEMKEALFLHM